MKKIVTGMMVGIVLLLIHSCGKNDCNGNCYPVVPTVKFRIVNSSGVNLLCGPGKTYTSDQVKVMFRPPGASVDSSIYMRFYDDSAYTTSGLSFPSNIVEKFYLYINNVKTDSFQVSYQFNEPQQSCCPGYTSISQLKLNNTVTTFVNPGNVPPVDVVK